MEPSTIITITYFTIYALFFIVLSIWSACVIKDEYKSDNQKEDDSNNKQTTDKTPDTGSTDNEHSSTKITNDDTTIKQQQLTSNGKKHGCKYYMKKWLKLTWTKRKIYLSIIPHLFDQATDYGVIATYYGHIGNEEIEKDVDIIYWFYLSIVILILHRVVSTFGVWLITKNWWNVLLQIFDLLMIKAVWTSYKLDGEEPSTSQRFLGLLEATFEAMPQLLLNAVFITKTGRFEPIIVVSFISSLWSLTSRVSADDKMLFKDEWKSLDFSYKECPCINFRYVFRVFVRFMEISSRVTLLTLMWINIGGLGTGIIIGIEFLWLLIVCIGYKAIMCMGNLMYLVLDWEENPEYAHNMWYIFIFYRLISSYVYLVLVTCFANIPFETWKVDDYSNRHNNTMDIDSIGFYMFIYSWIIYFIWPCSMYALMMNATKEKNMDEQYTGRELLTMSDLRDYDGICEIIAIGKKLDKGDFQQLKHISGGNSLEHYNKKGKKLIQDTLELLEQQYG